jgi:uncharacterized protein DUF6647
MCKPVILSAVISISISISIALPNSAFSEGNLSQQPPPANHRNESSTDALDRAMSMFDEIVGWLSSKFELPATQHAPKIEFASQVELIKLRAADRAQWQGFKYDDDPTSVRNIVAVYDTAKSTIYLPLGWTGKSPGDQSVLVHETVHHLQNVAKMKYECPAAREKIAYLAQDAWLRRSNHNLEDEFGVDMFTIVASSACM